MMTTRTILGSSEMMADISIDLILRSPFQPRIELNPMHELSNEEDMKLPLLVRKASDGQHYELVDGEGRLERLKKLGDMPARWNVAKPIRGQFTF